MRNKAILLTVFVCLFAGILTAQRFRGSRRAAVKPRVIKANNAQILPIRRVVLYSNGVAYIERRGIVSGNAEIDLAFKQSQVDDVLKSMIVLDLGKGRIGAISYNSSAPPSARMAEIPFAINAKTNGNSGQGGIAGVLSQLQGAKVLVISSKGSATGSILTVETRSVKTDNTTVPANFLVIASQTGEISNFNLADVKSVKLLDGDTKRDINEFANASASSRRRDAKTITITSEGIGRRELVVSYTIAAPIWKTTYRVVLDDNGKPFFQGWAIVDNVSEEDWKYVKLSLVSGSPVSFIQNLQKPLYRYRPVVPIPNDLNLDPQIYEAGIGTGSGIGTGYGRGSGRGRSARAPKVNASVSLIRTSNYDAKKTKLSDALINQDSGVETAATGTELGDLFEYKIDQPVTVPRNRSALIPIVQTKMEGERVSIYNESAKKDRPMSGLLLTNSTSLTFEGGSMTVFDRNAYAGEALMARLKPKEKRLISFAVDLGTLVSVKRKQDREPAKLIKAVKGVFQVHYFRTNQKSYRFVNQTNRSKIIWVEHPRRQNWLLSAASPKPDILTDKYYRFRIELKPFERKSLTVSEKQGLMESYRLSSLSRTNLSMFVARHYINASTRSKLEKLIELRTQISDIDAKLKSLVAEKKEISEDQNRLRENIKILSKTTEAKQLIIRYIQKVNDQETRIEQIKQERQRLYSEKSKARERLALEIVKFDLDERST